MMAFGLSLGLGLGARSGTSLAAQVAALFGPSDTGWLYDNSDFSTMFQDSAGTIPVTAVGQSVGLQLDKSGNGNHRFQSTSLNRPILAQDASGLYYLSYDGVNDSLATSAFAWGTDKATICAGVRKLSDAAIGIFVEISVNSNSNIGSFNIFAPESATPSFAAALRGNMTTSAYRMTSFAAPISNVVAVSFDISGATVAEEILPRVNAMTPSLTSIGGAAAGGGNFGTYPVFFGARAGTSLFFNGYEYSQFGINRLLTESELALVERYTNSRTGAY